LKRKLLIIFIILGISAELIFVATKFFGAGKSRLAIANKIESVLDATVEVKGKIEFKIFPKPQIVVSHVRINDLAVGAHKMNVRTPSFESTIPILGLLGGDVSFSEITLSNAKVELQDAGDKEAEIMKGLFDLPLKSLSFVDSDLAMLNLNDKVSRTYSNVNIDFRFSPEVVHVNGGFDSNLNKFQVSGELLKTDNNVSTTFGIDFTGNRLDISSDYDMGKKEATGSVKIVGSDFQRFIFNNLFSVWFFFPDNRKYGFESSFDFVYSESETRISEGVLKGDVIEGFFAGKIAKGSTGNINFDLKKFDFDAILTEQKRTFISEEMAYLNLGDEENGQMFVFKDKILINGVFQEINFREKKVGPLNLSVALDETGSPKIENLSFQFTDYDTNIISGFFNKEKDKYSFMGKINSEGVNFKKVLSGLSGLQFIELENDKEEQYKISANFNLGTELIKFYDIDGEAGEAIISGDVIWDANKEKKSALGLSVINLDFNNYLLANDDGEYRHLFHYIYEDLALREGGNSLLQQFLWLRSVFADVDYNFKFASSIYNSKELDELLFKGSVKHRFLELEELRVISDDNDLFAKFVVNLDERQPVFNLEVNALKADLEFLDYIEKYQEVGKAWSKDLIVFPNFDNVEFYFKSNFDSFKYHEIAFRDASFGFEVKQNILDFVDTKGKIDEGTFKLGGSFVMDGLPQLAVTYSLERFQVGNFVNFFFNIPYFSAKANLAGSLQTYGNTPYIMAKQIKSKNKYYLADVEVGNLAIPKIVQDVADLSVNPKDKFNKPMDEEIRNGSTKLGSINGELHVKNGVMVLNNIKFSVPGLESASVGKVDLVNKTMKINSIMSFVVQYKSKNEVKKSGLTLTHSLSGDFSDIKGEYDLFQLTSFVKNLKSLYIKAYNRLNNMSK